MEVQENLSRMEAWDEEEIIYREVWRMRRGEISPGALLERWPADNYYLQIALDPGKYPNVVPAEYLLKSDRSVAISKHARYNPMGLHTHNYFEMNYVVSGACRQRFEDGVAALSAGDFCMLSPEAGHCIEAFSDDAIVLNLAIRQSTFLRQFSALPRRDSISRSTSRMGISASRAAFRWAPVASVAILMSPSTRRCIRNSTASFSRFGSLRQSQTMTA